MTSVTRPTRAVIYCRVSGAKQVREGDGLGSQETRCREYASYKDYEVVGVFRDDISGGSAARPGMIAMLNFLKKNRGCVVIIDDISRLARGLEAHLHLRTAIGNAGGKLESPSIEFGEDSDSILVENLLASVSQHQRQKNGEQTKNRMRARAMGGYWVFHAPIGYRYEKLAGHGKMLVRDEPYATIIQQALEGYACGNLETLTEIKRFLENQPAWPKDVKGEVHLERVAELLSRPVYAGRIDHPRWGLNYVPAKHEALVTFETWQAVQDRRLGTAKAPARKDLREDFPLRGFVTCACCGEPLTACWSTGRSRKYPYYLCDTKACPEYRKSVRKEKLEGEFEALLTELTPTQGLFQLAFDLLRNLWNAKMESGRAQLATLQSDLRATEKKVEQLLDRLVDAAGDTVVTAYERRVRDLEAQKALITDKIANCGKPLASFGETYRTAFYFLANPWKLWQSDRIEDRRAVLRLVFAEKLPYARNEGYRTAEISMPFKMIGEIKMNKSEMVPRRGIWTTSILLRLLVFRRWACTCSARFSYQLFLAI
jgi:site-specific DNA recombinase